MKKVICFHLYNDYSGSPQILSLILKGLITKGYTVELYTSNTKGFLSGIDGVTYHFFNYRWSRNKVKTFLLLIKAQLYMFCSPLKYRHDRRNVLFYINTICPIGAVLAAAVCRIPTLYHIHEKYVNPNGLHRLYGAVWKIFSKKSLFVSRYLEKQYRGENKKNTVVYNTLSPQFINRIRTREKTTKPDHILMICSLKEYKGVYLFVRIAKELPQYSFMLVVNGTQEEVDSFFKEIPSNLRIYPVQKEIHDFYRQADLVLNLSIPSLCVETFGLTLLEAMAYGLPVIAPPVGGPVELVENDYNGYRIDSRNIQEIEDKIVYIFESGQYDRLSRNAKIKSSLFKYEDMIVQIDTEIKEIEYENSHHRD